MKNAQPFDFQATLTSAESIICKIASQFPENGSFRTLKLSTCVTQVDVPTGGESHREVSGGNLAHCQTIVRRGQLEISFFPVTIGIRLYSTIASAVRAARRSTHSYTIGRITILIGRVTSPPTTTIASGFSISAPVPDEIMNGIRLMLPINALNNSARRRTLAPVITASFSSMPSLRSRLI